MYKEEKRLLLVWLLLITVTFFSWEAGSSDIGGADISGTPNWLLAAIMIVTFIKVRFVLLDFMELRHAPIKLRAILETWLALTCALLILGLIVGFQAMQR